MDHSMGWLSRFFSTKSGGPFQATIPLPIQCIVKLLWGGREQNIMQCASLDRDQCKGEEE